VIRKADQESNLEAPDSPSMSKSRIVFITKDVKDNNSTSKNKNAENIQVTVHKVNSNDEIKKVISTETAIKKTIKRKVYLNIPKPVQPISSNLKLDGETENEKLKKLKSIKSTEDEANFEPNYYDEEFDSINSIAHAKITC
jgi:hypothetical protein